MRSDIGADVLLVGYVRVALFGPGKAVDRQ
jgi:hypothetical protein